MTPRYLVEDAYFEVCFECGEAWPCVHDVPPLDEVEREDHGGFAYSDWEW